jgi:hypothetical protein
MGKKFVRAWVPAKDVLRFTGNPPAGVQVDFLFRCFVVGPLQPHSDASLSCDGCEAGIMHAGRAGKSETCEMWSRTLWPRGARRSHTITVGLQSQTFRIMRRVQEGRFAGWAVFGVVSVANTFRWTRGVPRRGREEVPPPGGTCSDLNFGPLK